MADNEQNGVTEENGEVQETEQTEGAENENENPESTEEQESEESEQDKKDAELPEWARNELARVRREAAERRTSLREAQEALSKAKSPEEFEAATKALNERIETLERSILVNTVAQDFDLPKELADVLKGSNEEELRAHAKTLAQFAVQSQEPENLRGGLNPSDDDQSFDPVAASRRARQRRY